MIVDLNPTKGHEQGNERPVLVMNDVPLPGDISIVMPITTKTKQYPLEVKLDNRTKTQGVVMCYQVRAVDLNKRNARLAERAPSDIVDTCSEYIARLTEKI